MKNQIKSFYPQQVTNSKNQITNSMKILILAYYYYYYYYYYFQKIPQILLLHFIKAKTIYHKNHDRANLPLIKLTYTPLSY